MEKWLMIVNPSSASATTGTTWKESEKILLDGGLEVDVASTEYAGHAIKLAQDGAAKGYRKFISVGGDGTIHEVMSGLVRYADQAGADLGDFTLGVLPYGTGNDWIKTSGIPKDMSEAAKCIVKGNTAKEDIVRMSFEDGVFCMANIGGIGVDADICVHTNNLKNRGYKGDLLYKLVAPFTIFTRKRRSAEIICDGEKIFSGKLFTAVLGNGLYRGGGLRQTEDGSSWDDGLAEVSIHGNCGHIKGFSHMMHIFKGDFAYLPGVVTKRFRKLEVKPLGKDADVVESDGETPGKLPVTIELTGQKINIIVP